MRKKILCEHCDQSFEGSYNLFSHMETAHDIPFPVEYGKDPAGGETEERMKDAMEAFWNQHK